ncbi:ribosome-associated protein [Maridesulfovibrio ferrireducens]|uniref:Ribosome-associated protein n=1 Tax=Maridesulfovibrio ferrireducens TaxID=246191 RepID=A0A1G9F5E3_9BACT|nr:ribosome biogenesis factor YjgA [Maridesulfovibrio ferrireducens]SDK83423.1 ribosome-associated protein [Maridesulfovibrio ferrireducens]
MHNTEDLYDDEEEYSGPSRSQKKRDMTKLQKLAEQLMKVGTEAIKKSELPKYFIDEVLTAKAITAHEAKRRQTQYLGKLMREIETQPVIDFLNDLEFGNSEKNMRFHQLEKWREKLLEGDQTTLDEIMELHPHAERQRIAQLARNAKKEIEAGKPPKSSKALFKALREVIESAS